MDPTPLLVNGFKLLDTGCRKIYRISYCISLSIDLLNTKAGAVQICGNFWDSQ